MIQDSDVILKYLPDGRVCVHWFVRDEAGPIRNHRPSASQPKWLGGGVGYIACNPTQNTVQTQQRNGKYYPCYNTDDPRNVSCPECQATELYKKSMAELAAKAAS